MVSVRSKQFSDTSSRPDALRNSVIITREFDVSALSLTTHAQAAASAAAAVLRGRLCVLRHAGVPRRGLRRDEAAGECGGAAGAGSGVPGRPAAQLVLQLAAGGCLRPPTTSSRRLGARAQRARTRGCASPTCR